MHEMGNVYCGIRDPVGCAAVVFRNGKAFHPETSLKVRRHSPDGFAWGYCGSGPAQLALALLLDAVKSRKQAEIWYQQFKAQVVSGWGEQFAITQADILRWLQNAQLDNVCKKERNENASKQNDSVCPSGEAASAPCPPAGERLSLLAKAADQSGE